MVRIKGANSDYRFDPTSQSIQTVSPWPNPLWLNLYLCPYDQPSPVESHGDDGCCGGRDRTCPHPGHAPGHALVQLHQDNGIALVTDHNNQLVVDQQGRIVLQPAQGQVELRQASGPTLHLEITAQGWAISLDDGPAIHLRQDGGLELTSRPQSQVTITGDLAVTGDLTVTGNLTSPTLTALTQRLTTLEHPSHSPPSHPSTPLPSHPPTSPLPHLPCPPPTSTSPVVSPASAAPIATR